MAVPNIFGTATAAIPLSQLDTNFATAITLGNTAVYLGNTTTSLGNVTLTNVTVSSGNVTVTGANVSGNLTFTGTGNRITGDFSNATFANRVAFQTSTTNSATTVLAIPNGTGTTASWDAYNNSDPTNSSYLGLSALSTEARLSSTIRGTGTYLPMTFYTGGSERMRIDTSGNVGIGTSSPSGRLHVESSSGGLPLYVNSTASAQNARIRLNSTDNASSVSYVMSYSHASLNKQAAILLGGTGSVGFYVGQTAGAEPTTGTLAQTIDSSGNVGIGTSSPAAKLDVRGSSTFLVNATNPTAWISVDSALTTGSMYTQWNTTSNVGISGTYTNHAYTFVTNNTERLRIDSSGNLLIGYTSSNGSYKLQVNSQIFATNATIATSDGRYKENIQTLDGALSLVSQLNPVQFSWKEHPVHNFDRSGPTIGFIAQEVEQVLVDKPYLNSIIKRNECVIEPEEKDAEGNITKEAVTEEFLGIAEGNMIALLTKALQELKADFDAYKASHP